MEKPNDNSFRFYSGQFWTSGRDIESCRGQLRWCTGYLNDYLKKNLFWKKGTNVQSANNSCVYIDYDDPQVPSLGLADCSEKKKILCEVKCSSDLDTVNKEIAEKKDWLKTFEKEQGPRKIFNFILDVTYDAMDEFYSSHFQLAAEMISKLYDCRDIAKVIFLQEYRSPVPVSVNVTTLREPLLLVSLPGSVPNLHAVPTTDELKYQTDVFCRFPPEVVMGCMTNRPAQIWEY
ncbi:Hypothetical predicted protein [Cloeon dipterum]|uniref:C-type lectin domain-containing protein n=1 Tax=Cloeon dipterum TaxID=197152 RepID=A0A8S1DX62_9INSE|nr:Hypothetical predicted protein [Cloeon dipterum]